MLWTNLCAFEDFINNVQSVKILLSVAIYAAEQIAYNYLSRIEDS